MKTFEKLSLMAAVSLCALSFTSCDNGDAYNPIVWQPVGTEIPVNPGTPEEKITIVGEWCSLAEEGNFKEYQTIKYNEDGTANLWFSLLDAPTSLYFDYNGTYTASDTEINLTYENPLSGGNLSETLEIKSLDKYTLTTLNKTDASVAELNRVVATLNMKVGETATYIVDDANFTATEYSSVMANIATVDAAGTITAVKRGLGFIRIKSSIGTAVVRVVVTDPDQAVDDYLSLVGGSIDKVDPFLGGAYITVSSSVLQERQYALVDDMVSAVTVDYFNNIVQMVVVEFREGVDFNAIIADFNSRYTPTGTANTYMAEVNGVKVKIFVAKTAGFITYTIDYSTPDPDPQPTDTDADYQMFDNLIGFDTADQVAEQLNYTIDEDEDIDDGEGLFVVSVRNNNVFRTVSVGFDGETRALQSVSLRAKKDFTQEEIESWYKSHYVATGNERKPYRNEANTYTIRFRTNSSDGSISVIYEKVD